MALPESTSSNEPNDPHATIAAGQAETTDEASNESTLAPIDPLDTVLPTKGGEAARNAAAAFLQSRTGRYSVLSLHAKGGLGQVSLALDDELRRSVALKEIQAEFADDREAQSRFVREAEITGRLEHPGVVPIYGLGFSNDGRPYYAMRFIQGKSLRDAIEAFHAPSKEDVDKRRLKFRELLRRMIDVCNTMHYAHSRRIVHRDLKPANVMVGEYGETLVVDWGLAKSLDESEVVVSTDRLDSASSVSGSGSHSGSETLDGSTLGTPQYMSPEQAAGRIAEVDDLSDVYSLGATLYHLLAGRPPFGGRDVRRMLREVQAGAFPPPRSVRSDVPAALNSICLKAMATLRSDRYVSAKEIAAEIERWLADEPVKAHGEGFAERWYRRMRRHRSWVLGVATMVPLLLVVMTAAAYLVNAQRLEAIKQRDVAVDAKDEEAKQRLLAEQSEKRAKEQEAAAESAAVEAGRSLARLLVTNAERSQSESDLGAAALWSKKALPTIDKYEPEQSKTHRIRLTRLMEHLPRPLDIHLASPTVRNLAVTSTFSSTGEDVIMLGGLAGAAAMDLESGKTNFESLPSVNPMPVTAFSSDGKYLLTAGTDSMLRFWDMRTGESFGDAVQMQGKVPWVPGSFDTLMAVDKSMRFVAVNTKRPDNSFQVECFDRSVNPPSSIVIPIDLQAKSLQFQPGADRLMIVTKSGARFYDPTSGRPDGEAVIADDLWTARISPDGKTFATTSGDGYAQLWRTSNGESLSGKLMHRGPVTEVVFSPSGESVVTLSADLSARVWNVATGEAVGTPMDHRDRPISACFRGDGKAVATIGLEHKVYAWDVETSRLVGGPWHHAVAPATVFQGDDLLIAVQGRSIRWDLSRSQLESEFELSFPDLKDSAYRHSASFLDNDDRIVAADESCFWIVDLQRSPVSIEAYSFPRPIAKIAFSKNGRTLAALSTDNRIELRRLDTPATSLEAPTFEGKPTSLYLDDQGRRLLIGSESGSTEIWDLDTQPIAVHRLNEMKPIQDADFSDDGTSFATVSADGTLTTGEAATGTMPIEPATLGAGGASCVQFHPDGRTIAVGFDSDEIVVCRPVEKSTKIRRFRLGRAVSEVRFSNDGRLLVGAGYANRVSIWDWQAEQPVVDVPSNYLSTTTLTNDSSIIGVASIVGTSFGLWDSRTGRMLGPLQMQHTNRLEFGPAERRLMTVGKTVSLWNVQPTDDSEETLDALLPLLSQRKIDDNGTLRYLSSEELLSEFDKIKRSRPDAVVPKHGTRIRLTPEEPDKN